MSLPLYQVDAFTDRPFAGNPAAVCVLDAMRPDAWLQAVAAEINLSETAYLLRERDAFRLRWFTPHIEVRLCGHATLASAHALWSEGHADPNKPIAFDTLSGRLTARRQARGIETDFPLTRETACEAPTGLPEALGCTPRYVGRNEFDFLVECDSAAAVRSLAPDYRQLATICPRGVIVTSRSDEPAFDFVSRFFAPAAGIDEDPVTGSAHCCLAEYWGRKLNKWSLVGYQASPRGGTVRMRLEDPRVFLSGDAVTISRGELLPTFD